MSDHPWDEPVFFDIDEPIGVDEAVARGIKKPEGSKRPPKGKGGKKKPKEPKSPAIPALPAPTKPLTSAEVKRGVSVRDRAAVNLKLAGASYAEIADTMEFDTPAHAKRAVERALALTHSPDDWETLRMLAAGRAEALFQRSFAMAGADYLVDEDGNRIPNVDKLRWHQQAAADLMNHAVITGAKAPTKIEITPDEEKLDAIVSNLMSRMGHEDIVDAEVIELEALPAAPADDLGEE